MRPLRRLLLTCVAASFACGGAPTPTDPRPTQEEGPREVAPTGDKAAPARVGEVLAVIGQSGGDPTLIVGAELHEGQTVAVPVGARAELQLAEGVRLRLDEATTVTLPVGAGIGTVVAGEVLAMVQAGAPELRLAAGDEEVRIASGEAQVAVRGDRRTYGLIAGQAQLQSGERQVELRPGDRVVAPIAADAAPTSSLRPLEESAWAEIFDRSLAADEEVPPGIGSLTGRPAGSSASSQRLALTEHTVKVTISGRIALTEIEQTFASAADVDLEGTYRFPLPADASISGLSLLVGDRWMDGEMLERGRARKIFKEIVDATIPRDPALLEWEQGNTFSMKIFPIPAKGSRKVRLSYTQVLPVVGDTLQYRYPLAGGGASGSVIGDFDFTASIDRRELGDGALGTPMIALERRDLDDRVELSLHREDFRPTHSLGVDLPVVADDRRLHVESFRDRDDRGYFMLAVQPDLAIPRRTRPTRVAFVVDRSQSMTPELWTLARGLALAMTASLDPEDRAVILACDTACDAVTSGLATPAELSAAAPAFFDAQELRGASDLAGMLRAASRALGEADEPGDRVIVLLGDGQATAGPLTPAELLDELADDLTGIRLEALALGARADLLALEALSRRGGGEVLRADGRDDLRALARALQLRTRLPLATDVEIDLPPGLSEVYPRVHAALRSGDTLTLIGRVDRPVRGDLRIRARGPGGEALVDTIPISIDAAAADSSSHAHLPRTWARLAIDELTATRGLAAEREIVALSQRYNVLSRYTALIALESDEMFRQFKVARRSKSTTGWDGSLAGATPIPNRLDAAAERAESSAPGGAAEDDGLGTIGLSGNSGSEGIGVGYGKGAGSGFGVGFGGGVSRAIPELVLARGAAPTEAELARLERLRAAVQESPTRRTAHRAAVAHALEIGVDATADAMSWVEVDPDHAPAHLALGDALAAQGDPRALRAYASAVEAARFDAGLQRRLADGHASRGDLGRSCAHRRAVISIDPRRAEDHVALARCLHALGEPARAQRAAVIGQKRARDRAKLLDLLAAGEAPPPVDELVRGNLSATVTWEGEGEVEVALIDERGRRRSAIRPLGVKVGRGDHEQRLALWIDLYFQPTYAIEVTRVAGDGDLRGTLEVRGPGESGRYPFTFEAASPATQRLVDLSVKMVSPKIPQIGFPTPKVIGSTPKEIVRRIVRAHINEIRFCYSKGLASRPNLRGKIEVDWAINSVGQVPSTKLSASTLGNPEVETCVLNAIRRWSFPKSSSVDLVHQIFTFKPE